MMRLSVFPIGSKVQIGNEHGKITGIVLRGQNMESIIYYVSIHDDGQHIEIPACDFELKTTIKKVDLGIKVF